MDTNDRGTGDGVALPAAEKGKRPEDVGVNSVFNDVMNTRVNQTKEEKPPRQKE